MSQSPEYPQSPPSSYPAAPPQYGYGYPSVQQNYNADHLRGTKYKEKALIYGIIGFFVLGIVFGPLAIINAKKAEELNHSATYGKVLGWVDTILAVLGIVFVAFIVWSTFPHHSY